MLDVSRLRNYRSNILNPNTALKALDSAKYWTSSLLLYQADIVRLHPPLRLRIVDNSVFYLHIPHSQMIWNRKNSALMHKQVTTVIRFDKTVSLYVVEEFQTSPAS